MKMMIGLISVGVFGSVALSAVAAEKQLAWPQFRGPNGSGVAEGQKPPVELGPEKNVKWKVPAPGGLSSPIAAGDKLVLTAFEDGKLYTIAYNRADGKEAWRAEATAKEIERHHKTEGSPAASTPVTDGERIVSYFGSCGLVCYDLSGKELWKFAIPMAASSGDFGTGTSPILADGTVVVVKDEPKGSKIFAVDAAKGTLKWEKNRQSPASYSTPVVWNTPDGKYIAAAGHARMIGYDPGTGAEKWSVDAVPSGPCASPVVADGILFFAGWSPGGAEDTEFQMPSYDSFLKDLDKDKDGALSREEAEKAFEGFFDNQDTNKDGKVTRDEWDAILKFMKEGKSTAFALKPGGSGDVSESHLIWKQTKGLPYIASAIVYRGRYFMVKDGGIVTAYDAKTGKEIYQERLGAPGSYYASPVAADGRIYFTSLQDGTITVLKGGSDTFEVAAKNPKLGERIAATPAIADNALFVRTDKHLYAFAEKE